MAFQTASMMPGIATVCSGAMGMGMSRAVMGCKNSPPSSTSRIAKESQLRTAGLESGTMVSQLRDLPASYTLMATPRPIRMDIRQMVAGMSRGSLAAATPTTRRTFMLPSQTRHLSTSIHSRFQKPQSIAAQVAKQQRRTLFGVGGASTSTLAFLEEAANQKPMDSSKQYTFYQALLRANMPKIVIERYQSQRFASNPSCEALYHQSLGVVDKSGAAQPTSPATQNGGITAQLQAVGQAIAAKHNGANVAISQGSASGGREAPLYVVVEETIGSKVLKWVKFVAYFALFTYISVIIVTMLIDSLQVVRKAGGKADHEAKAESQTARFSDVHGCEEAKEELQELVEFLKNPDKFSTLGGKLPKGVLLVGPPGTGKTLLARAVAGEAGVPFFFVSGSEFDEMYVGVGAKRVRDLFAAAKAKSPAIIFIDELDAIGGKRNDRDANYVRQTLNQLLTELDGFEQTSGIIILGATNFPESLDKALTRPGRFDRNVVITLPDVRGRMAILQHHMRNVPVADDVNVQTLAAGTPGFSGADLENVINQAAVHASKDKQKTVSMLDFEWAKDKVLMGAEKRSMVITPKEKEMTAYHEAGHALVGMFTPGADPLHKVTVMPRGQALGITFHLPPMDKYSQSMEEYRARLDVAMGGKVAEEIQYGSDNVTSGVSSDLRQATQVAYAMVTRFGMSDKLGNVDLASNHNHLSVGTKELIESEVRRLTGEAYTRAHNLLTAKRKEMELLAKALVEYETLNEDEVRKVIRGEKLKNKIVLPSGNTKLPDVSTPVGGLELPPLPGGKETEPVSKPSAGPGAVA